MNRRVCGEQLAVQSYTREKFRRVYSWILRTVLSIKTKCVTVFSLQLTVMSVLSYCCLREDLVTDPVHLSDSLFLTRLAGLLTSARTEINL